MSPTQILVPTFRQMLRTLSGLLDKAAAQRPDDIDALLAARLAPDMYPLATQVRFAAYQAQETVFRLTARPIPAGVAAVAEEARTGTAPVTIAAVRARLDEALAFLDGLSDDVLDAGASRPIALDLPNGMGFDLGGEAFVRDWALPQFYFHVLAAYAILRAQGIDIGKADYVPHMFAYLRPGTVPAA